MASNSLGTLTLDLIAKIGGFTGPLEKAQREAEKQAKQFAVAQKGNERAVNGILAAMNKEVLLLGRTSKEKKLFELATRGATKAQLDQARASIAAIEKFETQQKVMQKNIEQAKAFGKFVGTAFAAAGAAVVANTVLVVKSARELENLSRVANENLESFQNLAYAAKPFGIEQEKLSDILKDVNDKVGDFLVTGQGPLADFFENIAPRVGLTADAFRDLSGSEALGLYISSLEKAGVSQSEMTFFMEAIASDATLLLPLFRDNSKELNRLTAEAKSFGIALTEIEIGQLKEADEAFRQLSAQGKALSQDIAMAALPAITELAEKLKDPQFVQSAKDLAAAFGTLANMAADAVSEFALFGRQVGETAALISGNVSELDKIEGQIRDIDRAIKGGLNTPIKFIGTADEDLEKMRLRLVAQKDLLLNEFTSAPVQNADALKFVLDEVTAKIEDATSRLESRMTIKSVLAEEIAVLEQEKLRIEALIAQSQAVTTTTQNVSNKPAGNGMAVNTKAFFAELEEENKALEQRQKIVDGLNKSALSYQSEMAKQIELMGVQTEYERALYDVQKGRFADLDEAQKQAIINQAQLLDQAELSAEGDEIIEQMQQQIDMIGMQTDYERTLYELQKGRFAGLDESQKMAIERQAEILAGVHAQMEAEQEYLALVAELRTDEEKRTDQLKERLAIIDQMADVGDTEKQLTIRRSVEDSFDTDPEKADGENFDAQRESLEKWYAEQMAMLDEFRAMRADQSAAWDEQELATRAEYEQRMTDINTESEAKRREQLSEGFSSLLDVAGKYYEGMEGEEAAYTRAAIQLGKTLLDEKTRESLKSIVASTHAAAMGAYESLSSIPVVGPALGATAAAGIYIAGGIAAAEVTGMAHDGLDSVPKTGTWFLEAGERVTTENTSAKLDRTLDDVQSRMDGVSANGSGGQIRIVNVPQTDADVEAYLGSRRGERVIINILNRNSRAMKSFSSN